VALVAVVALAGALATPGVVRRVSGARDRAWAERQRQQQAVRDSVRAEVGRRAERAGHEIGGEPLGVGAPTEAPGAAAPGASHDAATPGLLARARAWLTGLFGGAAAVAPEDTLPDSLLVPKALADSLGLKPGETLVRPGEPPRVVPGRYEGGE
jgi:hypothetical protein